MNRCFKPRTTQLAVSALEDRCTPATAVYAAATQTLTVTAAAGDMIDVAHIAALPTGYIIVSDGATVFDSSLAAQPVRNLVVHFDGVNTGALTLLSGLRLGGNVSIFGAQVIQAFSNLATIGGNLTYTASTNADDTLTFHDATRIGGNLKLNLGAGTNTVRLRGGQVGGNLSVIGLAGADSVELAATSDLWVGGSASFNLGDGDNTVTGVGTFEFAIGKSLTYKGGSGADTFDMQFTGTSLRIGGNFSANLGDAVPMFPGNTIDLNFADIGGDLSVTGGASRDTFILANDLTLGGNLTANLGDGVNQFNLDDWIHLAGNVIGGNLSYTGGADTETVMLRNTTVYKNVSVKLGDGNQTIEVGHAAHPTTIYGSLKIAGGAGHDWFAVKATYVGNGMTLQTGADDDEIRLDDVTIAGPTSINLGAGNDQLLVETVAFDSVTPLSGISNFGGVFKVDAGSGDDTVNLSDDLDATTYSRFGAKLSLIGGLGNDTLLNAGNVFLVTGNFEDFEAGAALP
jgi:hypothetical protein